MSLLEELKKRKGSLKHTQTRVKLSNGEIIVEERSNAGINSTLSNERNPGFVIDTKPDLQLVQVIPGLCLGTQDVAQDIELLRKHSVTHVISLGVFLEPLDTNDITQIHIPLLDLPETNIVAVFSHIFSTVDAVREEGGNALVHCNAGVSRSPAAVIGYLMQDQLITFQEAHDRVRQLRPVIKLNPGFQLQLMCYQTQLGL